MGEAGGPGGKATGRLQEPEVRRLAGAASSPERVVETSQMWEGNSWVLTRKSLSPTGKASSKESAPVFLGASSWATKAMAEPSGRQANCWMEVGEWVSCKASPPARSRRKIWLCLSESQARKARRSPVGDQRGKLAWWRWWVRG